MTAPALARPGQPPGSSSPERYGGAVTGPAPRPLLFLDVDGPLIPFGGAPRQYQTYQAAPAPAPEAGANPLLSRINPQHGPRLIAPGWPCTIPDRPCFTASTPQRASPTLTTSPSASGCAGPASDTKPATSPREHAAPPAGHPRRRAAILSETPRREVSAVPSADRPQTRPST